MKKINYILLFVISSFLFLSNVRAETYNLNVPIGLTNLTDTQMQTIISTAQSSGANTSSGYLVRYIYYNSQKFAIIGYNTLTISGNVLTLTRCKQWNYSSDFTSSTYFRDLGTCNFNLSNSSDDVFILWSSKNILYPDTNNIYNYTYIDKTFTQPSSNDLKFYSISEIRDWYYTDPYPLFTSFFDIVLEKLELVCEFFTSSYIYLSIFVIIMFYFIILLMRRLI